MDQTPARRRPLPLELKDKVDAFAQLADAHAIDLIVLFGSRAAGTNRRTSDYDLGFWFSEPPDNGNALRALHRAVQHIMHTSRIDLAVLNSASALLSFQAARGLPVFERRPGAFAAFCLRAVQKHDDARRFYVAEREYLRRRSALGAKLKAGE